MGELLAVLSGNELEIELAQESATIYFTRAHITDLKQVIAVDQGASAHSGSE
jgi:hypothetical protein